MSTYNYQFQLDEKGYAVQITPFEEDGKQRYRIAYNDSSALVVSFNHDSNRFEIVDKKDQEISEALMQQFVHCIHKVQESEQDKPVQG
jgi:hypothetical protein